MKKRILKIKQQLREHDAEAALLTFLPDIRWACGFSGSNGALVVRPDAAHFLSDGRYETQARREVEGAEVHTPGYKIYEHIAENDLLGDASTVLFQSDHTSVARLHEWRELFPEIAWVPVENVVAKQVAAKEEIEIEKIRRAQHVTDEVFERILDVIAPGMTEKEVAAEIVYLHMQRGADKMSFDPVVASGAQGALPHARPTDKLIEEGDVVVIDMGCFLDGYASDMTRTVAVGEPGEEAHAAYRTVLAAQRKAIEAARSGLSSKALDQVARDEIEAAGYEDYFSHGLGHGVGLQIHEWPRVSYHVDYELPENAVVTIEPGVYLPEQFGVRIEDTVVLRKEGCENLTASPKDELIVL